MATGNVTLSGNEQGINEDNVRDAREEIAERALTVAQRARAERNRQRARALREARLARPAPRPLDTGGGFMLEESETAAATRPSAPPAPIVDPSARPECLECGASIAHSFLFDTFGYSVCDACRDDAGAHALVARTDAKAQYLLQDCDLDDRPPPLRSLRRRNPHGARRADMRLYLRAQLLERAILVWGSSEALERERERRDEARVRAADKRTRRRLRALRMDVRSTMYTNTHDAHTHTYDPETYDVTTDLYTRHCSQCGHTLTYEKM